jgi:hypothetical protein
MRRIWAGLIGLVVAGTVLAGAEHRQTPAEVAGYRSTPDYAETMAFIRGLADDWPSIQLTFYGESAEGRPMPVVIVSNDHAFTPQAARSTGKAIVMIQNGIHAGEIDGNDACLAILRDLTEGRYRELLDEMILVILPIYNVDGHARVSIYHRPNQNGPVEGMGFRTTTDGHDLNRDHLKLSTPEARAMIGLFNRWQPHLHVDNHVTDGVDHAWVLTYAWAEAPQLAAPIDAWMKKHMPAVKTKMATAGHLTGPYVWLVDSLDPTQGFESYAGEPRYSSGYYPLRNRVSILVENHSRKPYQQRVTANRDYLLALMDEVANDRQGLVQAVADAEQHTIAAGKPDAPPSRINVSYKLTEATETISFPVYDWFATRSEVTGEPFLRYHKGKVKRIDVPWVHRVSAEVTLDRPRGYLILPGWPGIAKLLTGHGVRVEQLTTAQTIEVETLRISNPVQNPRSAPSYQGLTQISVDVARGLEKRQFPAGSLWIPADQPDFEIAVQLIEPESPDSMVSWGLLSAVLERKEYISVETLEGLVQQLLKDKKTAAEWKRSLKDESFAADDSQRYLWWYRRTPYWDETVGLLPTMRLLTPPHFETKLYSAGVMQRGGVK